MPKTLTSATQLRIGLKNNKFLIFPFFNFHHGLPSKIPLIWTTLGRSVETHEKSMTYVSNYLDNQMAGFGNMGLTYEFMKEWDLKKLSFEILNMGLLNNSKNFQIGHHCPKPSCDRKKRGCSKRLVQQGRRAVGAWSVHGVVLFPETHPASGLQKGEPTKISWCI